MRAAAHPVGLLKPCAQGRGGFPVAAGNSAQAQHLLPGAWPQRDVIRARGRLRRQQRIIRIDVAYIPHALLFDQITQADQRFQEARDDPASKPRDSSRVGARASF